MGGTTVEAPPPRNYGQETRDTLQAQIDLAPQIYEAEAKYRPLYTRLDMSQLEQALLGSPSGTRTTQRQVTDVSPAGWYNNEGRLVSTDPNYQASGNQVWNRNGWSAGAGGPAQYQWRNAVATPRTISETTSTPGQRGLLDIYAEAMPRLGAIESADQARKLAGELGLVQTYGSGVVQGLREAAGNAELIRKLNQEAEAELNMGATLDPSLRREVAQAVRAGQSARGMGTGPGDVAEEALYTGLQAEQLRRARQQFAAQVASLDQATSADPFMALLGRSSGTWNSAPGYGQQAQSLTQGGNRLFNPESPYAQDIYNTNYNAQAAANIAGANSRSGMIGAGIGAAGLMAAAGILA